MASARSAWPACRGPTWLCDFGRSVGPGEAGSDKSASKLAGGLAVAAMLALGLVSARVSPMLDAAKLAVDEINANGGILKGQKLQMIVADTQGTAEGAV